MITQRNLAIDVSEIVTLERYDYYAIVEQNNGDLGAQFVRFSLCRSLLTPSSSQAHRTSSEGSSIRVGHNRHLFIFGLKYQNFKNGMKYKKNDVYYFVYYLNLYLIFVKNHLKYIFRLYFLSIRRLYHLNGILIYFADTRLPV